MNVSITKLIQLTRNSTDLAQTFENIEKHLSFYTNHMYKYKVHYIHT